MCLYHHTAVLNNSFGIADVAMLKTVLNLFFLFINTICTFTLTHKLIKLSSGKENE